MKLLELLSMDMHEQKKIPYNEGKFNYGSVLRVPGGWVYTVHGDEESSSAFVPEPETGNVKARLIIEEQ